MPLDNVTLDEIFKYHAPNNEQLIHYERIRDAARSFAYVIIANTPKCADQSAAIRHVREAVMTANASVALNGLI
jgi:hypothetical protein